MGRPRKANTRGNGSKASTSRKAEVEVIEETASEAGSYQEDPDWLATINQKFATTTPPPSESSNTNSEQEVNVRQTYVKSQKKSLTGVKNGGVKKAKATSKKQIERWDFFNPVAAFTQGVQSDVRKPGEVQKITQYRKLIGNTRSVSFQYHTYEDRNGDLKKYPAIMFVNSYTIARDQLKDPINDDGVRYKTSMFYISQYQQLVDALEEMKRCNPELNWPTPNEEDRAVIKHYQGDGSFEKV